MDTCVIVYFCLSSFLSCSVAVIYNFTVSNLMASLWACSDPPQVQQALIEQLLSASGWAACGVRWGVGTGSGVGRRSHVTPTLPLLSSVVTGRPFPFLSLGVLVCTVGLVISTPQGGHED